MVNKIRFTKEEIFKAAKLAQISDTAAYKLLSHLIEATIALQKPKPNKYKQVKISEIPINGIFYMTKVSSNVKWIKISQSTYKCYCQTLEKRNVRHNSKWMHITKLVYIPGEMFNEKVND